MNMGTVRVGMVGPADQPVLAKPSPWWGNMRKPWWFRMDKAKNRLCAGLSLRIGWFEPLWIHVSRGFGRPAFCLRILGGRRQFSALFMWDTAHVSRLGNVARFLSPLQSVLWVSFTGWTTGSGVCCQSSG